MAVVRTKRFVTRCVDTALIPRITNQNTFTILSFINLNPHILMLVQRLQVQSSKLANYHYILS